MYFSIHGILVWLSTTSTKSTNERYTYTYSSRKCAYLCEVLNSLQYEIRLCPTKRVIWYYFYFRWYFVPIFDKILQKKAISLFSPFSCYFWSGWTSNYDWMEEGRKVRAHEIQHLNRRQNFLHLIVKSVCVGVCGDAGQKVIGSLRMAACIIFTQKQTTIIIIQFNMVFVRVFAGFSSTRVLCTQCQVISIRFVFDSFTRPRSTSRMHFGCCNLFPSVYRTFIHSFVLTLCIAAVWYVCDGIRYFDALFGPCVLVVFFHSGQSFCIEIPIWFMICCECCSQLFISVCVVWWLIHYIFLFASLAFFFFFFFVLCTLVHLVAIWHPEVVLLHAFLHFISNTNFYQCCALKRIKWRINWMNKTMTRCV